MKKTALFLLLLAAAGGGAWFYLSGRKGSEIRYEASPAERGDLVQVVTATGQLNPVVNVQVGSQISGNIKELFADFNTEVKAGDVVAQLDPATYQAVVQQAEADLASAGAALELARLTAARKEDLVAQKAAPAADLDAARAALRQAEATVRLKRANLDRASVDLARCTILSPIDGIVISRDVDVGQTVAASLQAPVIFTIANDLRNMQINANVAEADVGNVAVGQAVDFTVDAFPQLTFHGEVTQVRNAPITVQNVVTYDAVISVSNDEMKLKPGMTANVSIVVAKREGALLVPNAALRFRPPEKSADAATPSGKRAGGAGRPKGGSRTIYILGGDGKPRPVPAKIGITDGIRTEVLEGLAEGDRTVTAAIDPRPTPAPGSQPAGPFGGGVRRF
jgi:HlyD family secretion protein